MEAGRVRERLIQLQKISQDPEYDRYLAQMVKDLDAGRATPEQVEQEAGRSFEIYRQRMQGGLCGPCQGKSPKEGQEIEFRIGMHVFGMLGIAFMLVAFFIFGINFLQFETAFTFLVFTMIYFIINIVGVILQKRKKRMALGIVQLSVNFLITVIVTGLAWKEGIGAVYLAIFVITAFLAADFLSYIQCKEYGEAPLFPFLCIENGLFLFLLFLIGNVGKEMERPAQALFVHLISEALVVFVCTLLFFLWDKADGRRFSQVYYGAAVVLLLSSFSQYPQEIILGQVLVLLAVKLANRHKEMAVLECIAAVWAGAAGLWLSDYWYCWIFAGILILGLLRVCYLPVFQEVVTTVSVVLIWWSQCRFYLDDYGLEFKWFYPVGAGALLLLFLLAHHAPWLGKTDQTLYNILNITGMGVLYLAALFGHDLALGLTMMALGGVAIWLMFGKRYRMYVPRRYLMVAGLWLAYALICCVDSPVLTSILLMVTALGCVGIGYKLEDRAARICGLAMAIFVCMKLVLFDFARVRTIHKMIVFFTVGILALVISFLYILLDKNVKNKQTLQAERKLEE